MTDFPDLKVRALVSFPASIIDGIGIDTVKANGSYQFNLDYEDFAPPISAPPDLANQCVLFWNQISKQYALAPIASAVSSASSFIQAGAGAVVRTMQDKAREIFSVKDFGAIGDGATDNTAAIQAAIAAVPYGGTLYFPAGFYVVSGGGAALFTITRPINILGAGVQGTVIAANATVPATTDIFLVKPPVDLLRGFSFRNICTSNVGGSVRDAIRIDTTATDTAAIAEMDITNCFFVATNGYSIRHVNNLTNTNGGMFNSNIDKCTIQGGIRLDHTGDSIRIRNNIISTSKAGISGSQIANAGNLLICGNNISAAGGAVVMSNTICMLIDSNEFEQQALNTEANNAIIDLIGTDGTNQHPIITNNILVATGGTGNPTLLRLGSASDAVIDRNFFATPAVYVPVIIAAGVTNTLVGAGNKWPGLGTANITDGGTGTIYVQTATSVADQAWTPYTPTVTAAAGTFTAVSAAGFYRRLGKTVFVRMTITITTPGSAAQRVIATLPFAGQVTAGMFGGWRGDTKPLSGLCGYDSATAVSVVLFDGTFPGAGANTLWVTGFYEAT